MKRILCPFVGGSRSGQILPVIAGAEVVVMPTVGPAPLNPTENEHVPTERYNRRVISIDDHPTFAYYTIDSLSPADGAHAVFEVLAALISELFYIRTGAGGDSLLQKVIGQLAPTIGPKVEEAVQRRLGHVGRDIREDERNTN